MTKKEIEELSKYLYEKLCNDYRHYYDKAYNDKNDNRDGFIVVRDCMNLAKRNLLKAVDMAIDKFEDPGDDNK